MRSARARRSERRRWQAGALLGALLAVTLLLYARRGPAQTQPPPATRPAPATQTTPAAPAPTYPRSLKDYPWLHTAPTYEPLAVRCPTPKGYTRAAVAPGSWGEWLRYLPLLPAGSPVRLKDDVPLLPGSSPVLAGVVDLDVRKNQECADVIFRLRAEFLRWAGREAEISFPADNVRLSWQEWKRGVRPRLVGRRLVLERTASPDASRSSFDKYLAAVFAWSGTYSMAAMGRRASYAKLRPGDFFAHPGESGGGGHGVLIADVMRDAEGHTWVIVLQGYIPAQSAQLASPDGRQAWIPLVPYAPAEVPRWGEFKWSELREFR